MKNKCSRIVHNQHFFHKAYNMPVCKLNRIVGHSQASMLKMPCNGSLFDYQYSIPIHGKMLLEGRFEKFKLNIQANTLPAKTIADQAYFNLDNSCKAINSIKNHILYLFNRVKGKCMSIVYQFDCYCITKRFLLDIFCNTKRIHFTECKYGNLQSDFPGFYRNKI